MDCVMYDREKSTQDEFQKHFLQDEVFTSCDFTTSKEWNMNKLCMVNDQKVPWHGEVYVPQHLWGHWTTCRSLLSSTVWVLGLSGLAPSVSINLRQRGFLPDESYLPRWIRHDLDYNLHAKFPPSNSI